MSFFQKTLGVLRGRNFRLYISFVVVASLFWMIEQLRRDYTTTIQIPILVKASPENYIIDHNELEDLSLKAMITSDGYTLLQHYLFGKSKNVINVDVNRLPRVINGGNVYAVIAPQMFYSEVSSNIEDRVNLRGLISDSLFIPLHRAKKKYLPIIPRVDYTLEQQHILSDEVRISPSHVWINGTNNILDTMNAVYTKTTEHFVLHDTLTLSMPLDLPEGVETNVHQVDVTFCVESFTEKSIEVPITAIHIPDGYIFRAFPHTAKVTFTVGMSEFENVGENDIDVVADLSTIDIHSNSQQKVKLHIASAPASIMNVSYTPVFVEFLLEKTTGGEQ